ncbi:2'-5' RNA ligase [Desulfurobacterium pacificum]|uniref:RNA 2',3'-cyclic phosphodiesterase n=1 Tax=Desulfurobacterium pacificum TaxID=240166 RepID=A0ABY1NEG1_9BACT|nr:RNA 2',3'-cyclic phosphodiesterase [Desulfurobacterium pacificum]SMP07234.1 2'-5' RNA ligase [Desulfurobacterium pacificum]
MKKRLFIGTKVRLDELDKVRKEITSFGIEGKWVEEENLHFTYRFLGDFEEEKIPPLILSLKGKLKLCRAPEVVYRGVGFFEKKGIPRVFFVRVESEGIQRIKNAVDQALLPFGYPLDKEFVPHVTLLRIKRFRRATKFKSYVHRMKDFVFGEGKVNVVTLFESKLTSQGPIYTAVEEFHLD